MPYLFILALQALSNSRLFIRITATHTHCTIGDTVRLQGSAAAVAAAAANMMRMRMVIFQHPM